MHSSSHPSVPLRPRRFDTSRRTSTAAAAKPQGPGFRREDKNMNTIPTSSPRRVTKGPTETTRARVGVQTRAPVGPSRLALQKRSATPSSLAKPKPKNVRIPVAAKVAPPPPPPLPPLALDPNCNEPSLPCLCCDGRSPQEHNSMFNHNHNNNNTVSIRQQLKLQPPPPPPPLRQEPTRAKAASSSTQPQLQPAASPATAPEKEENLKSVDVDNKPDRTAVEENEEQERSMENEIDGDVDDDSDDDDEDDDDDDDSDDDEDDDDTLVPSCCDCPPSLLDLSLTSSTSSSSTSISSCSDLESDCADLSNSLCSSQDHDDLSTSSHDLLQAPECYPSSHSFPSLPLDPNPPATDLRSPPPPCSPDEGYPSAPVSPTSDYLHVKGQMGHLGSEVTKFGLLDFLESIGEFGKMERFSQVIQVARWDLDGDQQWDLLRYRLDHLDHLEKVNRQVKLAHIARLHEKGLDLGEMEGEDLSDVLDEMGNIDIPWKLYKGRGGTLGDSQEFSDAGVDLSAPSDCDEPLALYSLTPSPVEPPPRPPKPPARFASVNSDLHTYINISRETTSMAVCTSPSPTFSTFSPSSSSPTFSTFRCERALPPSPPSIPPLPVSQPMPYFTLYTAPLLTLPSSAPPIPPPRKRHLARKEAQRLAALQAQQEKTPLSLPPPTIRPPPLPPPPVISVSSSSPPVLPPPPALPPPPSFHALDVEIRKLLMLAGVTQAELLKLSPELGDCVGGLENGEKEGLHITKQTVSHDVKRREESNEEKESNMESVADDGWTVRGVLDRDRRMDILGVEDNKGEKDESRDVFRTTSFTEMARRRKRTSGLASDTYYSNTADTFKYSPPPSESPPPPPPRPLPPIPPSLPPLKVCTLSDNLARPERFDWLMAFTPDGESRPLPPPLVMRKSAVETPKRLTTSSSGSSSGSGSGSKVTTFKEIRNRGKNCSPPTRVITDPEPDPNVITPDPDILYNLKWRREKVEDDGIQWEYTSQAQAVFMNPPPLTSLAAFREMFQKAEDDRQQAEARPAQQIGCSSSESNLWSSGEDRTCKRNEEEEKEEELEVVRGRADGGRTLESRTAVSSPPLSLAQSRFHSLASPYFLHSTLPPCRPGYSTAQPQTHPRPHSHTGRGSTASFQTSVKATDLDTARPLTPGLAEEFENAINSAFTSEINSHSGQDPTQRFQNDFENNINSVRGYLKDCKSNGGVVYDFGSESVSHFDSLYCDDSEEHGVAHPDAHAAADGTQGCTTPYKNIDAMMTFSEMDSLCFGSVDKQSHASSKLDKSRASKELPPLPNWYLYHPKNCPLHRGAPPRLSPVGALSPPLRSGAPPSGLEGTRLSSPLFPRSHTLAALAAPLYYPYFYPPIPPRAPPVPPRAPPVPPKLNQAPPPPHALTVRSVSFAGSTQREGNSWMGDDEQIPMRGLGLSSLCLQEKRALVSAVSVAVEAILTQFSTSRTVVQKTLSGDSSLNPSLGRLVLQCLCPVLHNLLSDGLKPHQSDLIAGRRPNSAWGLVQASTRPGPDTQSLHNLQLKVRDLAQLKQSKHRFNAFLLGLLNIKKLDFWLSHLQSCNDVLETYYRPSSFMRLSFSTCQHLFEELILLLQPLSLLTFNLDLLFQHHHLEPVNHSPDIRSPPNHGLGVRLSPRGSASSSRGSSYLESLSEVDFGSPEPEVTNRKASSLSPDNPKAAGLVEASNSNAAPMKTSPQLLWVQEKEMSEIAPPCVEEASLTHQAGQVLQQGWGAVVRLGGRLSQNLSDLSLSAGPRPDGTSRVLPELQTQSDFPRVDSCAGVPFGLGRLFGASKYPNNPTSHSSRRPSQWLTPGVTALTRMVSSSSTPKLQRALQPQAESEAEMEREVETMENRDKAKPLRSVRTLCDHSGTGVELSFQKGEELVILGGVDQDWIRCRQGDKEGLVPIGYASLII